MDYNSEYLSVSKGVNNGHLYYTITFKKACSGYLSMMFSAGYSGNVSMSKVASEITYGDTYYRFSASANSTITITGSDDSWHSVTVITKT